MDVSICILTHSQPDLLPCCVASALEEIGKAAVKGEVILIDNASSDGSPQAIARLFPQVRIIRNDQNLGFSAANNEAIRASTGTYTLLLNDDAILQPGSLRLMLRTIDSDPTIAAVGPKLLNPDGSIQRGYTNRRLPRLRSLVCAFLGLNPLLEARPWTRDLFTHSRDLSVSGETEHIAGACLLVRRDMLERIGLFDEQFYYLWEDADLCYRLREAGGRIVYLAEAQVAHHGSASLKQLMRPERAALYFQSLLSYYKKHGTRPGYLLVRIAVGLISILRSPRALWREAGTRNSLRSSVRSAGSDLTRDR
jgi:N-acetylglucosaminyl-diphospho-decaprenol L-rhamnosyltransferase